MPPRKPEGIDPNADASTPPPGATEDATETQERQRRSSRNDPPTQGNKKPAHLRGQVTKIQGALVEVHGSFVNPTGEPFDEPSDWRVRPPRHQADQVKKYLKEGDDIQTTGLWLPTQESWDGEPVQNAFQAFEISRPLDAPSLVAAPEISGGADGGVGLG